MIRTLVAAWKVQSPEPLDERDKRSLAVEELDELLQLHFGSVDLGLQPLRLGLDMMVSLGL